MNNTLNIILYIFIFVFVAMLLGLPFLFINNYDGILINYILKSLLIGVFIGLIMTGSLAIFYKNLITDTFLAFFIMFIGTGVAGFLEAYLIMQISPILYLLLMILAIETTGMLFGLFIYRKTKRINKKLNEVKELFKLNAIN